MSEHLGLSPQSRILDVGCGPGRIAIGILDTFGGIQEYCGVDVSDRSIEWAKRHIGAPHPNFRFIRLDVHNLRFNPDGSKIDKRFAFPFEAETFDVICLYSVFSHMLANDVRTYLRAFRRILRSDGKVYLTAHLDDGVPNVTENPDNYRNRRRYKGPLDVVRYNREFFEKLVERCGFRLEGYGQPSARKVQQGMTLSKADQR